MINAHEAKVQNPYVSTKEYFHSLEYIVGSFFGMFEFVSINHNLESELMNFLTNRALVQELACKLFKYYILL